jgi:hypothetical protein
MPCQLFASMLRLPKYSLKIFKSRVSRGVKHYSYYSVGTGVGDSLVKIDVKYVPDALLYTSVKIDYTDQTTKIRLYMYSWEISSKNDIPSEFYRTNRIIDALKDTAVCFPSVLPSTESIELRTKEGSALTFTIKYLGFKWFSNTEVLYMQRYHRAVIGWTLDNNQHVSSGKDWSESSHGSYYYIMPLHPSIKNSLDSYGTISPLNEYETSMPDDWIMHLQKCSEEAQNLTLNFVSHKQRDNFDIHEYFSSHTTGSRSNFTSKIISHSNRDRLYRLDMLLIANLIAEAGMTGKMSADNLIEEIRDANTYTNAPEVSYIIPKLIWETAGESTFYFAGMGLPSLLWRLQSLYLAQECIDHISTLYKRLYPSYSALISPSVPLMLTAITPRMAYENIDSER